MARQLQKEIENIFKYAKHEVFQTGYESTFSKSIQNLVKKYGDKALEHIDRLCSSDTNPEIVSEALQCLGYMDDKKTHDARLEIIKKGLLHKSDYVRDGAGLGLSYLNDGRALESLFNAIKSEKNYALRKDLSDVYFMIYRRNTYAKVFSKKQTFPNFFGFFGKIFNFLGKIKDFYEKIF